MRISDWSSDVCSSDLYLSVAAKANGVFMTRFRRMTGDLTPIDSVDAQERAIMAKAPLYRIYETGMDELDQRRQTLVGGPLSAEPLEALRAGLAETGRAPVRAKGVP